MQLVEQRNLNYSVILHVSVLLFAIVGLPVLLPPNPDPTPMVMSVEVLPISEESNVKPSDKPIQKEQHAPAKPVKAAPAPTPPKAVEKPAPTPPPPPEKTKAEPKPFDPMEGAEPAKKEDKPKPKDEPKKPDDDFAKLMANLKKTDAPSKPVDKTPAKPTAPAATPGKDATNTEENKTKSDAPYDASKPMSMSEKDAISSQFRQCWNPPIGAKDAASLIVLVKIELQPDATVKSAVLAPGQESRYGSDTYFRAAADSAIRAAYKCSPLKNMPADKYDGKNGWNSVIVNFDPKDMM